jgi:hypothetical protein
MKLLSAILAAKELSTSHVALVQGKPKVAKLVLKRGSTVFMDFVQNCRMIQSLRNAYTSESQTN